MHAGKPQDQAIAIAYSKAGKSRKKKKAAKRSNPTSMMTKTNTKKMVKYLTGGY